ncbi:MAG: response regulator transcription factor [Chloroflexi bacterium]|nr:response regulator transcription factor [Chloroflexota bacterium]
MSEAMVQAQRRPRAIPRNDQPPTPVRVAVALAIPSPLLREGLRRVIEGEDSFEVVWTGDGPPSGGDGDWAKANVVVIGGVGADGEAADTAGALERSTPTAAKVLLLDRREEPPPAVEAARLGIAACLPLDARPEDVLFTLRTVARGYTLLSTAQPDEACPPARPGGAAPTAREAEVLLLLAEGIGNREIAERLCLSHRTVEWHVANLLAKAETHNRTHLVAIAQRIGWLD